MRKSNHHLVLALLLGALFSGSAQALVITTTVAGTDNLYYDDWGHVFNSTLAESDVGFNIEYSALGRGTAASAVGYAFSSGQALSIAATGSVADWGATYTDPTGTSASGANEGWDFRNLPVYSLIGIWSTNASMIDPVNSPFYIGSSLALVAPAMVGSLYLFLGENDGYFRDNAFSDKYTVTITTSAVPAPATLALLSLGLIGLIAMRRHQNG